MSQRIESKDLADQPNPYLKEVEKVDVAKLGKPVLMGTQDDGTVIDKRAAIMANFEYLETDMAQRRELRKRMGKTTISNPIVFYAQVVKSANDMSVDGGYVVRVAEWKTHAGQGHETAIQRLINQGHYIIGHDLPSIEEFEQAKVRAKAYDIDVMVERFAGLLAFVKKQIAITKNEHDNQKLKEENSALVRKLAELEKAKK